MMLSKPVFVIGSARSGTELVVQILNRHPNMMIAAETHYFDDLRPRLGMAATEILSKDSKLIVEKYFKNLQGGAYGLNGTENEKPIEGSNTTLVLDSECADDIFLKHCLAQSICLGKNLERIQIWGEKTPRHVFCITEIVSAFPDAKFIFMQRDPRGVIASYRDWKNHFIDTSNAGPALLHALKVEQRRVQKSFSIGIIATMWCAAQKAALRGQTLLGTERVRIQKFEDLLSDPDTQIADLCSFLQVDYLSEMRSVRRVNSSYVSAKEPGIDVSVATAWKERMTDRENWIVETLCRAPMSEAGYLPVSKRAYPSALAVEIVRTGIRIPQAFMVNWHRIGAPLKWILRRLGIGP